MTESCSSKPMVLVVDDSRLMRLAARKILKNDFEILEAEDGEVAWDKLQDNNNITLVMSDLSMPNLDGLGLLKKIRESSQPELKELPVIIVTGAEDDDGSKKRPSPPEPATSSPSRLNRCSCWHAPRHRPSNSAPSRRCSTAKRANNNWKITAASTY